MAKVNYMSDQMVLIEVLKYTHIKLSWREEKKGEKRGGNINGHSLGALGEVLPFLLKILS